MKDKFNENLREARRRKKLTQQQLNAGSGGRTRTNAWNIRTYIDIVSKNVPKICKRG